MSDYDLYKGSIEAIENCSKLYRVKFEIGFRGASWRIKVMQKIFNNKDFLIASRDAVLFVFNAHNQQKQKDDTER